MFYRVQYPLIVWSLELVSNNSFSCRVLAPQVQVSKNILSLASTSSRVLGRFEVAPDAGLYTGDRTHIPLHLEDFG